MLSGLENICILNHIKYQIHKYLLSTCCVRGPGPFCFPLMFTTASPEMSMDEKRSVALCLGTLGHFCQGSTDSQRLRQH